MNVFVRLIGRMLLFFSGLVLVLLISGGLTRWYAPPVLAQPPVPAVSNTPVGTAGESLSEAIARWQAALQQAKSPQERATILTNLGQAYRQQGRLDQAIAQWTAAAQLYQVQSDPASKAALAQVLIQKAQAYSELGQQAQAVQILDTAIALARELRNPSIEAIALAAQGKAYWGLGDYNQAETAHFQSLQLSLGQSPSAPAPDLTDLVNQLPVSEYGGTVLNNLGNVYVSRAERFLFQANATCLKQNDAKAVELLKLVEADGLRALQVFQQSVAKSPANLVQVRALLNYSRLLERFPYPDLVLITSLRQQAVSVLQGQPNSRDRVFALINLAQAWIKTGTGFQNEPYALIDLKEGLQLQQDLQAGRLQQSALCTTARSRRTQEGLVAPDPVRLSMAQDLLQQAIASATEIADDRAKSFALGSLGQVYELLQDPQQAIALTQQAQLVAQQVNASDSLYRWQWQMGRLLRQADPQRAIAFYKQAVATLKSIRGDIVAASRDLQFDFRDSVEPVYRELIELLLTQPAAVAQVSPARVTAPTVAASERGGAIAVANQQSLVTPPESDLEKTKGVQQEIRLRSEGSIWADSANLDLRPASGLAQLPPNQSPAGPVLQEVLDILESLKLAELQNFFGDECVQIAQSIVEQGKTPTPSRAAIVYSIILTDRIELILRPPTSSDQLASVATTAASLRGYAIPINRQDLQTQIETWRRSLTDRATLEYRRQAQDLYNLLIRPLEAALQAIQPEALIFIQDGPLRQIPMAALYDGQQYLIEKYPLATTPGLQLTTREPFDRRNLQVLALGLTVERTPFAPLVSVTQELAEIRSILGGTQLVDRDFTEANLQAQVKKADYSIVHMATHGVFGVDADSTFLLTYDRELKIQELDDILRSRRRQQPLELLTLSACETAAGDDRSALGIAGVAVRAGVKSAVATLWSINDEATVALVETFYQQLRQPNVSRAKALQQAQISLIKDERIGYNHPAIWSPFLLIGNWL